MRSGDRNGRFMDIGITKLTATDVQRLIAVLHSKLGLTSTVSGNGRRLKIHNLPDWMHNIIPIMHESQLYRLETRYQRYRKPKSGS